MKSPEIQRRISDCKKECEAIEKKIACMGECARRLRLEKRLAEAKEELELLSSCETIEDVMSKINFERKHYHV